MTSTTDTCTADEPPIETITLRMTMDEAKILLAITRTDVSVPQVVANFQTKFTPPIIAKWLYKTKSHLISQGVTS